MYKCSFFSLFVSTPHLHKQNFFFVFLFFFCCNFTLINNQMNDGIVSATQNNPNDNNTNSTASTFTVNTGKMHHGVNAISCYNTMVHSDIGANITIHMRGML